MIEDDFRFSYKQVDYYILCFYKHPQPRVKLVARWRLHGMDAEEAKHLCHLNVINISSIFRRPSIQALMLSRGAWLIALCLMHLSLGECRQGLWLFWCCRTCLGYGLVLGLTLKETLCRTCPFNGICDKSIVQVPRYWIKLTLNLF